MPRRAGQTRENIVSAATHLFYDEGIRSVSMDSVAEKAGVTKRTLYYHFDSKDDLIAASLEAQDQPTLALFARWFDETDGPLADKIEGMFTKLASATQNPKWKGCGFTRTAAELASTPGHPALKAGAAHKKKFEAWLADRIESDGREEAAALARQILVLLDGSVTVMMVHRDPAYISAAGRLAGDLLRSE